MKNLIERLQEYGQSLEAYHLGCEFSDFCDDIVSELERLQTENTKLIAANKAVALDNRKLRNELEQVKTERDAAIKDMCHIAEEIERCDVPLDETGDKVNCLKLGRCDVRKHGCHEGNGCNFEWRGLENEQ